MPSQTICEKQLLNVKVDNFTSKQKQKQKRKSDMTCGRDGVTIFTMRTFKIDRHAHLTRMSVNNTDFYCFYCGSMCECIDVDRFHKYKTKHRAHATVPPSSLLMPIFILILVDAMILHLFCQLRLIHLYVCVSITRPS